jgi:hypothetical protein
MKKEIIFTKIENVSDEYFPTPASKIIPEWYKKTYSYIGNKEKNIDVLGNRNQSIKKCIPVFDALISGYIITTYCDLWISKNENGETGYSTSSDLDIQFHAIEQAPYHPKMNNQPYPKWLNPWSIKTPSGYSCLFINPVHGGNTFFTIGEGVVDTDSYTAPVNFPFVINDPNFQGLIPAGTPMAQVIPFKRESWKIKAGSYKDKEEALKKASLLSSRFFDRYKNMFWHKKEYN